MSKYFEYAKNQLNESQELLTEAFNTPPYDITMGKKGSSDIFFTFTDEDEKEFRIQFYSPQGIGKSTRQVFIGQKKGSVYPDAIQRFKNPMRVIATMIEATKQFLQTPVGKNIDGLAINFSKKALERGIQLVPKIIKQSDLRSKLDVLYLSFTPVEGRAFVWCVRKGKKAEKVFDGPKMEGITWDNKETSVSSGAAATNPEAEKFRGMNVQNAGKLEVNGDTVVVPWKINFPKDSNLKDHKLITMFRFSGENNSIKLWHQLLSPMGAAVNSPQELNPRQVSKSYLDEKGGDINTAASQIQTLFSSNYNPNRRFQDKLTVDGFGTIMVNGKRIDTSSQRNVVLDMIMAADRADNKDNSVGTASKTSATHDLFVDSQGGSRGAGARYNLDMANNAVITYKKDQIIIAWKAARFPDISNFAGYHFITELTVGATKITGETKLVNKSGSKVSSRKLTPVPRDQVELNVMVMHEQNEILSLAGSINLLDSNFSNPDRLFTQECATNSKGDIIIAGITISGDDTRKTKYFQLLEKIENGVSATPDPKEIGRLGYFDLNGSKARKGSNISFYTQDGRSLIGKVVEINKVEKTITFDAIGAGVFQFVTIDTSKQPVPSRPALLPSTVAAQIAKDNQSARKYADTHFVPKVDHRKMGELGYYETSETGEPAKGDVIDFYDRDGNKQNGKVISTNKVSQTVTIKAGNKNYVLKMFDAGRQPIPKAPLPLPPGATGATKPDAKKYSAEDLAVELNRQIQGLSRGDLDWQSRLGIDRISVEFDFTFRRNTHVGAFQQYKSQIQASNNRLKAMKELAEKSGFKTEIHELTLKDAQDSDDITERNEGSAYSEYEQSIGGRLIIKTK